jgi:hypothetical protein
MGATFAERRDDYWAMSQSTNAAGMLMVIRTERGVCFLHLVRERGVTFVRLAPLTPEWTCASVLPVEASYVCGGQ